MAALLPYEVYKLRAEVRGGFVIKDIAVRDVTMAIHESLVKSRISFERVERLIGRYTPASLLAAV